MQQRSAWGPWPIDRIRRAFASSAVLGVSMVGSSMAVAGCSADCTETEGPATVSNDQRHAALVVHRSCGGAAGAEEDRVFVVDGNGHRALTLRLHHQLGDPALTWSDDEHLQVHIDADASIVESDTSVEGVTVEVVRS